MDMLPPGALGNATPAAGMPMQTAAGADGLAAGITFICMLPPLGDAVVGRPAAAAFAAAMLLHCFL